MSTDQDTTRIVRSWLKTDEHESADRVLDAALVEIDTTRQRRARHWPARRLPNMNNIAKLGFSVAVIAVAALIGFMVIGGGNIGGPGIPDPSSSERAGQAEALVRAWVEAVNRGDRDALISMTAANVTLDTVPASREDAIDYVLRDWCPMTVDAVEGIGDSVRLDLTFRDKAEGTCVAGVPGTSSSIVLEVRDGKVTRIP